MSSPRITAVVIALNEERNLPALCASLAWADEMVVVDGGSHDATVELARQHAARVFTRPFDNYASQRNFALEQATGDWLLSIDADERPTPRLADEIRERTADARCAAYRIPIKSTIFGRRMRFSGTQDDRPVRLFRRGAARWQGDVHETLCVSGRVGRLQRHLEHHTLPELHSFLGKMHRYTRLAAAQRVAAGIRPQAGAGCYGAAREIFRRLFWKQGLFDGPVGWAFCGLSGLSEWVLAAQHARLWAQRQSGWPQPAEARP